MGVHVPWSIVHIDRDDTTATLGGLNRAPGAKAWGLNARIVHFRPGHKEAMRVRRRLEVEGESKAQVAPGCVSLLLPVSEPSSAMSTDPAYAHDELCHGAPSRLRQTTGAGVEVPGPDEERSKGLMIESQKHSTTLDARQAQPPDDAITVFDDTDIDIRPTMGEPIPDPLMGGCSPGEVDASESPSPTLYFPKTDSPTKESDNRERNGREERRGEWAQRIGSWTNDVTNAQGPIGENDLWREISLLSPS